MTLNPRAMARALGGRVSGRNVVALGPGHSRADRSLSIKIEPTAPDGFIVHPFAGDSPIECLDYVRARLGLGERDRRRRHSPPLASPAVAADDDATHRSALALRLWSEARDPRNTVVARYLAARGLSLPDDVVGDVIRFHPALKFNGASAGGMVALFRDIRTKAPCGIHRTFFDGPGRKLDRKMLGRVRDAAIKLDPDECVTSGVHIGEGLESCLAAWLAGFHPVWALGSASAIASFPALSAVEAVTVLGDSQRSSAIRLPAPKRQIVEARACHIHRWRAGRRPPDSCMSTDNRSSDSLNQKALKWTLINYSPQSSSAVWI